VNLHDRHAEGVAEEPGEYKAKTAGGEQRRTEDRGRTGRACLPRVAT
jgi:hypothetical protein